MIKNYTVTNVNDLRSIAADFLESIGSNRIIAFYGSMGAGKTTFIKALCDLLKVTDTVNIRRRDLAVTEQHAAAVGRRDAVDDADQRRLAGPVGAKQPVDRTSGDCERYVVEGLVPGVLLGDMFYCE